MVLGIILLVIVVIGLGLWIKSDYHEELGVVITLIFGIWLVFHVATIARASYKYETFIEKRTAFVETIASRDVADDFENKYITETKVEWNVELAHQKVLNATLYHDQFVDDRFDNLKPIE